MKTHPRILAALALIATLLAAAPAAFAARVFLNGVEISQTDISNQRLNDVERVLIDEHGDVHIVAPGYDIRVTNASSGQPPRDTEAMRRILGEPIIALFVNETEGEIPYEFTLKVNGVVVETFESDQRTTAIDISGYMKVGENEVEITAEKVRGGFRASGDENVRLIIGPGSNSGGRATVRHIRSSLQVDADERDSMLSSEASFTLALPEDD